MSPAHPQIALVTGANGFLGRHVARRLAADGFHVVGLGHGTFEEDARNWGLAEWHSADVTLDVLRRLDQRPDLVAHCAGGSLVARSIASPLDDFWRTVGSTACVLEFIRTRAPQARLTYPSSAAVYGEVCHLPIAVITATDPISPYGAHKLAAEQLCRAHARQYGTQVSIVRFFSIYGPGLRKQLLWDTMQRLAAGSAIFAGSGREVRDWLHVEDAAKLIAAAADVASSTCPIANGGTGIGTSVRQIVARLARTAAPNALIEFAGTTRAGDPLAYVADVSEARGWGWSPSISWDEGVANYARWYMEQASR